MQNIGKSVIYSVKSILAVCYRHSIHDLKFSDGTVESGQSSVGGGKHADLILS